MDPRNPQEYIIDRKDWKGEPYDPNYKQTRPGNRIVNVHLQFLSTDRTQKTKYFQFLETLEDNLKYLSPRQTTRAKQARKAYQALGTPHPEDFKALIRMNLIRDNKVTNNDITLAEKTYGKDVGSLKGKTTRRRPPLAIRQTIEIPDELIEVQRDVTLSIDGLEINSVKFLSTISHNIYYRTVQYLPNNTAQQYCK